MFFFDRESCPVCETEFCEADDIVTCPVCGAPAHRSCYKEHGGCFYESSHGEGFSWQRSNQPEPDTIRCPRCGCDNSDGRQQCANCSAPLGSAAGRASVSTPGYSGQYAELAQQMFPVDDGDLIESVPVGDLKRFVSQSWLYYLPFFYNYAKKIKRFSFNLIAFFTHGMWFISRKMYFRGAVILLLMLAGSLYQAYCYPLMAPYYNDIMSGSSAAALEFLTKYPIQTALLLVCALYQYGIMFFSGFFGNRVYMKHCIRKVKQINHRSATAEEFNSRLSGCGGVAPIAAIASAAAYFLLEYYISTGRLFS